MRERLVAAFVGLAVAVIVLFGVPRAYFVADLVRESQASEVERAADLIAVVIAARGADPAAVSEDSLESLLGQAETVEYVAVDGTVTRAATQTDRPTGDDVRATRAVPGGGRLTLSRSATVVEKEVSDAVLSLVLMGVGLLVLSALVGSVLARRLARPFTELAAVCDEIGRGEFDVDIPHYTIPEADEIGDALRRGASRLDAIVQQQRDFAVNASHELRTPIAALRLELEDLAMWPETPPEVAAELRGYVPELKRLSEAVTQFLDTAREQRRTSADD